MDGRFDDMLLGLAQKHKGIEDLMYTLMSFFDRRTDLFHVKESLEDKKGYEAGHAEKAVKEQFRVLQQRYLERSQPHLIYRPPSRAAAAPAAALQDAGGSSGSTGETGSTAAGSGDGGAGPAAAPKAQGAIPTGVNASPLDGGDVGQWERIEKRQDQLKWHQSTGEVVVEIDVEKCKASDLKISFKQRSISVARKGVVLLEGKLHDKINCEESTWHLDEGKQIVLSMEKIKEAWWESLVDTLPP